MFVKLDDTRILNMSTGTCYFYIKAAPKRNEASELQITFNGAQTNKYCGGHFADGLWRWLNIAAMKFDAPEEALEKVLAQTSA